MQFCFSQSSITYLNVFFIYSQTSLLFDIHLGGETSNGVTSVFPVTMPLSIGQFYLEEPATMPSTVVSNSLPCELYAPTWVVFQVILLFDLKVLKYIKFVIYL